MPRDWWGTFCIGRGEAICSPARYDRRHQDEHQMGPGEAEGSVRSETCPPTCLPDGLFLARTTFRMTVQHQWPGLRSQLLCWWSLGIPGCIIKASGSVSYVVQWTNGRVCKRHQDHIWKWPNTSAETESVLEEPSLSDGLFTEENIAMQADSEPVSTPLPSLALSEKTSVSSSPQPLTSRYPQHVHVLPDRHWY